MKTPNIPKAEKTQVQGNRQGGGDQSGKTNRPGGEVPPVDRSDAKVRRLAEEARDPRGSAGSATLTAVAPEPID